MEVHLFSLYINIDIESNYKMNWNTDATNTHSVLFLSWEDEELVVQLFIHVKPRASKIALGLTRKIAHATIPRFISCLIQLTLLDSEIKWNSLRNNISDSKCDIICIQETKKSPLMIPTFSTGAAGNSTQRTSLHLYQSFNKNLSQPPAAGDHKARPSESIWFYQG
ncbi:hypothetical protein ACJX0J_026246 [Zea mays]